MSRRRIMMMQGGEFPSVDLPIGYKRCKYLECSGKQYIKTNVSTSSNIYVKVIFSFPQKTCALFCGRSNSEYSNTVFLYDNNSIRFDYSEIGYNIGVVNLIEPIKKNVCEIRRTNNTIESYFNDTFFQRHYVITEYESMYPIWIMSDENHKYNYDGKIYEFTLNNNIISQNFIPALDPSGKPCMYDTVTEQPFYNSGTGEFGYELLNGTYVAPI